MTATDKNTDNKTFEIKIGIFIPCFNVSNIISDVLDSFSAEIISQIDTILVINNCSSDNTLDVLKKIQDSDHLIASRMVIIDNFENYGLGGSQKIAYQYFLDNHFSYFMIIHGDNQGDGNQIAINFLETFKQNPKIDLIVASRFMKGSDTSKYHLLRFFGNILFNWLTFLFTGHKMSDSGAGILYYRTEILRRLPFQHLTNSAHFNPQLNILMYNLKDLSIKEINLNWVDSETGSSISGFNYCLTLLKILFNYRINTIFYRRSGWKAFQKQSQYFSPNFKINLHR